MSKKSKICQPALTSHIEVCHEQCSFTPLVVTKKFRIPKPRSKGIKAVINEEISQKMGSKMDKLIEESEKSKTEIRNSITKNLMSLKEIDSKKEDLGQNINDGLLTQINSEFEKKLERKIESSREEVIKNSKGMLDLSAPEKVIETREINIRASFDKLKLKGKDEMKIPLNEVMEFDGLGLFFKEDVCYRGEGMSYSPCGKEFTIMPGEKFSESNTLEVTTEDAETGEVTTTQDFTNTENESEEETFANSYDRTLKKETDIKLAREASFKAKIPFKIFNLDLSASSSGSINFNRVLTEVNKSSHTNTRKRFSEVIRKLMTSNTQTRSSSVKSSQTIAHSRVWENLTDSPMHFIKRTSFCKTSVLHKRHNVQLAWNGCIDNPSEGLCTGENLEEKLAGELQTIREKWNRAAVPSEFGEEPKDKKVVTSINTRNNNPLGVWWRENISDTIPAGWFYVGGTADAHIDASVQVQGERVESQPNHGATGTVTFTTRVDTRSTRKPIYTKFSYLIRSANAQEWHDRVNQWRAEQAQQEIDIFLEEKKEELNKFLASDQARATIERRIMEDFFGVTSGQDCCSLITRLRKLFDFDAMCFSLLPAWNNQGDGCQKAFPVTLYTADCLHFYLPIKEGMELEASILLVSVNAIGWSNQFAPQLLAYINRINTMRSTLYKRAFDPAGWDVKFDQPNGYDMTPYDSSSPDWSAAHESDLNYELLGAFTINVPCGERVDPRPALCDKAE